MPFLIGCLALAFPRVALFLVWLFAGAYLSRPYGHWIWPALGFLFLPLTTLAFAFAFHSLAQGGQLSAFGWLLVGLAVLGDLGLLGGGGQSAKRWRRRWD